MQDRTSWQMSVDIHLVGDRVDYLDRESGRENKLSKDGHDWLPSGRGRSAPGEDRPSRFPWPSLVATARQGHSSEGAGPVPAGAPAHFAGIPPGPLKQPDEKEIKPPMRAFIRLPRRPG